MNKTFNIDQVSKVSQIVIGGCMIGVTIYFSIVATSISDHNNNLTKQIRRAQIGPQLEIGNETNFSEYFENVIVRIKNVGVGTAYGLRAIIAQDGVLINKLEHLFVSPGKFGVGNAKGRQQRAVTLGSAKGKDHVSSNQEIEFMFAPNDTVTRDGVTKLVFTFFLSYLDVDGYEYLTVTKTPIGGKSALTTIISGGEEGLADSLMIILERISLFESKTFTNTHLRNADGTFLSFE